MEYNSLDFLSFLKKAIKDKDYKHECYKACVDHSEDMAVHVYGKTPTRLLEITRPNEDPAIKNYRLSVYQPKTKSTANKALSILFKIFNPSLFSIRWSDQNNNGKALEEYCMEYYPVFNSILVYLQETVLAKMIADPNGVLVIKPMSLTIPDTERANPLAIVYGSFNIWFIDYESCLIWKKTEKNEHKRDVYYFEWYDKTNIIELTAEFTQPDVLAVNEVVVYAHQCKEMPVWQLRGTPESQDDGTIIYKSFFEPAVPYWNDAIGHESDLKGAFINHIHPIRYEYDEECNHIYQNQQCRRGSIKMPDGSSMNCPACNGTGYKGAANSPYRIIRINRDKTPGTSDTGNFPVPAGFITVPTEPTDLLDKYVDKQHSKGLAALNMDIVDTIGENQSGVAKVIDRGELYDFLARITNVVFDVHLTNIFYFINAQMFGISDGEKAEKNLPTVVKPVQFDVFSTSELIDQLTSAKTAGMNPNYIRSVQAKIVAKEFTDPLTRQWMALLLDLDPIPDYNPDEINLIETGGNFKESDVVIHFNIAQFISRALQEQRDKFLKMDKAQQKVVLETYAQEIISANKTKIEPAIPPVK